MLAGYKRKTNVGVGFGILFQGISKIAPLIGGDWGVIISLSSLLFGIGLFTWGCMSYMKGKGYHGAWGLLGLLSIIGLIILVLFPDRHKKIKA